MNQNLIPVILAGGKGERFWPLSRQQRPKQFLCLDGSGRSLLQSTAERLLPIAGDWDRLWVITSAAIAAGVREQLPSLPQTNLLVEPQGRDTAAAIAWTILTIAEKYGLDAIVGFFPADHWIGNQQAFTQTLEAATSLVSNQEAIATLGISPNYPATGYGYIEQGAYQGVYNGLAVYRVNRFREKPDLPTAEAFLTQGGFSWNSGMFIFPVGVVLAELRKYTPEIISLLEAKGKEAYGELPKISIDYALMEKTSLAYVLPVDFPWDDLGDWNAIDRLSKGDADNLELAQHLGLDTHNCLFYAEDDQEIIVTIGVEDLVVVRDGNITLIVPKQRTQEIKQLLKAIANIPNLAKFL
ncbi:MAG: mannose-1-phosphate guanylyltransferase [Gloeocapsa sp. DLM2.Bin57]|nr:MAG: mannose-1-phosphate guanylyltransferase [Gloeocapsa sp. DLM2.Bin57]